jgi:hypothetical protein
MPEPVWREGLDCDKADAAKLFAICDAWLFCSVPDANDAIRFEVCLELFAIIIFQKLK